jgi:nicotinate phosphoribosyltransferase
MCYAYFNSNRHNDSSVFELFFRKPPFDGEITIFAGLDEVLKHVGNFKFSDREIEYIRGLIPNASEAFFEYLADLDCGEVTIHAQAQGSLVFPRVPLLRIEGPLGICQLLETTLLTLVNYPSLVCTNAARMRLAAGPSATLLEFGLRRAQGPDGGFSASKYCMIGGFDGTSNVMAGMMLPGVAVKGTHAHAFVQAFSGLEEVVTPADAKFKGFKSSVLEHRTKLGFDDTHDGELAAFISYALAFPDGFLALVDTYDSIASGCKNFICVALALDDLGFTPRGIRLDSGDLAYISRCCKSMFTQTGLRMKRGFFEGLAIVASNDINEGVLIALNKAEHAITSYGIGTNLVTCQKQPALGCVYKLCEINGKPRIKLSQDLEKVLSPGRKDAYRIYGKDGEPLLDLMLRQGEAPPEVGQRYLARHPFSETKRVFVTPSVVENLLDVVWDGRRGLTKELPTIEEGKALVKKQLAAMRSDHIRHMLPTPYKVSVSSELYDYLHKLWSEEAPVMELS